MHLYATEAHKVVIVDRLTTLLFRIAKLPNLSDRFNLQNGKVKIEVKNTQVSPELKRYLIEAPHVRKVGTIEPKKLSITIT